MVSAEFLFLVVTVSVSFLLLSDAKAVENINISIKENQLIIEAFHEETKSKKQENMLRTERYQGKYQSKCRTWSLDFKYQ